MLRKVKIEDCSWSELYTFCVRQQCDCSKCPLKDKNCIIKNNRNITNWLCDNIGNEKTVNEDFLKEELEVERIELDTVDKRKLIGILNSLVRLGADEFSIERSYIRIGGTFLIITYTSSYARELKICKDFIEFPITDNDFTKMERNHYYTLVELGLYFEKEIFSAKKRSE